MKKVMMKAITNTIKMVWMKTMLFGKGTISIIPTVIIGKGVMTPTVNLITIKTVGQQEIF